MPQLYTTANISIITPQSVSPEVIKAFRRCLSELLQEAADVALEEYGIENDEIHAIYLDEIEVSEDES